MNVWLHRFSYVRTFNFSFQT